MDDTPRSLTSHLQELRRRLFWLVGVWGICAGVSGFFASKLFELLMGPAVNALRKRLINMPGHQQIEQLQAAMLRFETNDQLVGLGR